MRTVRVRVRFRRPFLPHFGQGASFGAQWTGITIAVGASVPMLVFLVLRLVINLIHQGTGPIYQDQNGLSPGDNQVGISEESPK